MLLALSIIGFFLSLILLYYNFSKYPVVGYLAGFFFLISLYLANQYIFFFSGSVLLINLFFIHVAFLYYLLGPLFYWYIRSVLTDNSRLKKSDLWHFIPVFFFLIATLPFIFSSWTEKFEMAAIMADHAMNLIYLKPEVLFQGFPWWLVYLCSPVLLLGYTAWAALRYLAYIKKGATMVFKGQLFMRKWLPVLFVCLSVFVISHTLMILKVVLYGEFEIFTTVNLLQIISALGITGLLTSPFFFPDTLYGLPQVPVSMTGSNDTSGKRDHTSDETKKQLPGMELDYLQSIRQKADYCMEELKPYLQEDCNLANFARILKIPAHHLAYYFREEKKQSYNDYRNKWRIDHAKSLIREGKAKEVTLDEIGYLSGFSSRNAFFTAFKKFEGISPGIFAAQFNG